MNDSTITLDVREDLRQGRAPFDRILAAAEALRDGQTLRLIAPVKPVPLMGMLAREGFTHVATPTSAGDWEVLFTRHGPAASTSGVAVTPPATDRHLRDSAPEVAVDARGLEPPEPMVRVLEAVAALPTGATLRAHTDRRPLHLLDELTARGFVHRTEQQADGSFVTHLFRA